MVRTREFIKKVASISISAVMIATLVMPNINIDMFSKTVNAAASSVQTLGSGSIGVGSDSGDVAKLPTTNAQGTYRFTTSTYNNNNAALDTTDWATNWLWDLEGDRASDSTGALSGTAYAIPLSYIMKKDGLRVSKPSMTSNSYNISAYNIKDNDTLGDFLVDPDWDCTNNNIDEVTDWSYEAITSNPSNGSQYLRTTMTQGSPFTYFELTNSNVLYIEKLRVTYPSKIVYEATYDGCKIIVFRTMDITSQVNGYPGMTYQYYAAFVPEGTTVSKLGSTDSTGNDGIGRIKFTFPSGKAYMSLAWVYESSSINDNTGISYAQQYRPYAFNFITDTRADYSYNESTSVLSTTYQYSFDKKAESKADGTIMGILPHQYKYMSGYSYMGHQSITVRGMMKFIKGSSYKTEMKYTGILPYMPDLLETNNASKQELQAYVDKFMKDYMSGSGDWTLSKDQGNETYYHAKKLNRAAQVIAAANAVGDKEAAETVLYALQANLEEWFTYSGSTDKNYFTYYGNGVGSLLGFPTSFNAVDQLNDHHFHYGYFIEAAASVGLYDKAWLEQYKDVIKQLIYDIASPYRNSKDCVSDCGNAYPYLRCFAPYEGHSWASGYEDERTGNNQESTSEAINAWAGIILYGELLGDDEIRDLGIYLYTTEVAATHDYWFDIDQDIYKIENTKYEAPMASMVWGGKVDYSTWFGAAYTQGIQICPMNAWSFYYLKGGVTSNTTGEQYIKRYMDYDMNGSLAEGGSVYKWNDMWASYYALVDPTYAMNTLWTREQINDGESQAHTYHFIQSLIDNGTPDLSFTSDHALSSVFEKNGVYTYAVYNPKSTTENVTFTAKNGKKTTFKAAGNSMTLFNSNDEGKPSYTVEYYGKNLNSNGYTLLSSSIKYANAGSNVTADIKDITGYKYNSSYTGNVISGNVNSNSTLVLKVYYDRAVYSVAYDLVGGEKSNTSLYTSSYTYGETYTLDIPTKEGYDFYGWYTESTYKNKLPYIQPKTYGNLTLYAKWIPKGTILTNEDVYLTFDPNCNGTFTIIGDKEYKSVNVLYRISDTESEAAELANTLSESGFVSWGLTSNESGWTRTENFSGSKGKYITFYFIRYDDYGGYKTAYGYGKITAGFVNDNGSGGPGETSSSKPSSSLVEVFGMVSSNTQDGVINVVWGNPGNGQKFNVYLDGSIATNTAGVTLKNIDCGSYNIYASAGSHTVKVTTTKDGEESVGVSQTVNVVGDADIPVTTKPAETTKPVETTTVAPGADGYVTAGANWTELNYWSVYFASGWAGDPNGSYKNGNSYNDFAVKVAKASGTDWGVQLKTQELAVESGAKYVATIKVTSNMNTTSEIRLKEESSTTEVFKKITNGENTFTLEFTAQNMAQLVFDLGKAPAGLEFVITSFSLNKAGEVVTEKPTEKPGDMISDGIEINGYQISSAVGGFRTIYSVEPTINGKEVKEVGLIYGLRDFIQTSDMVYNSDSKYVANFAGTKNGIIEESFSDSDTATSYTMTMKFAAGSAMEFSDRYTIRAYAVLSDGTVAYTEIYNYTIYDVASYLYDNHKMSTLEKHNYLYNKILLVVNPAYTKVDFTWTDTIVKKSN